MDGQSGEKIIKFLLSSSLRSVKYNETESISPPEKDQSKNDTTAKINQEKKHLYYSTDDFLQAFDYVTLFGEMRKKKTKYS